MPIYLEIGPPAGRSWDPKDTSIPALDDGNSIRGTVTETYHQNWIELTSCQIKGSDPNASNATGRTRWRELRKDVRSLVCTRNVDGTSPELMKLVAGGANNGNLVAWIDFVEDGTFPKTVNYFRIKMGGVAITSYQASPGRAGATETFELTFEVVMFHDNFYDHSATP